MSIKRIADCTESIPTLSTEQMIEVDRLMISDYQIQLPQMMENAGRCLAIVAVERFITEYLPNKKIVVLAGPGGNGGGAMVCARRLLNWGANVQLYLSRPEEFLSPVTAHQLRILKRMGVRVNSGQALVDSCDSDLIIDGIIGYRIKGDPRGLTRDMIEWANRQKAPVLSLDTPSGLDLSTGRVHTPAICATATLTLALPKHGHFMDKARGIRGELYLGDISVPPSLYALPSVNIQVSHDLFRSSDVLRIQQKERKPENPNKL